MRLKCNLMLSRVDGEVKSDHSRFVRGCRCWSSSWSRTLECGRRWVGWGGGGEVQLKRVGVTSTSRPQPRRWCWGVPITPRVMDTRRVQKRAVETLQTRNWSLEAWGCRTLSCQHNDHTALCTTIKTLWRGGGGGERESLSKLQISQSVGLLIALYYLRCFLSCLKPRVLLPSFHMLLTHNCYFLSTKFKECMIDNYTKFN